MPTLATEYNDTLAQAQLDALKSLHRMVKLEQDPARLCRMTAILMRAKPIESDRTLEAEKQLKPNRDRQEADRPIRTTAEPAQSAAEPTPSFSLQRAPLPPTPHSRAHTLRSSAGATTPISLPPSYLRASPRSGGAAPPRSMPSARTADG
jgi:hypothetical protein